MSRLTYIFFILFFFYFSDKWITKIYEYAHEYQMDAVLLEIENVLCKKVKATEFNPGYYNSAEIKMTIALLLLAEKYSISELISTAVKKLSTVPRSMISSASSYGDLTSNSKFMISDMRLERVDNNKYLKDN